MQVLKEGDRVAVVGDGQLGLLVAQMLVSVVSDQAPWSVCSMSRACAVQVLREGDRVALVGDGKLRLLGAQMLVSVVNE